MATITKYTLISGKSAQELVNSVNEHIVKGWHPIGGPIGVNQSELIQAMVHNGVDSGK